METTVHWLVKTIQWFLLLTQCHFQPLVKVTRGWKWHLVRRQKPFHFLTTSVDKQILISCRTTKCPKGKVHVKNNLESSFSSSKSFLKARRKVYIQEKWQDTVFLSEAGCKMWFIRKQNWFPGNWPQKARKKFFMACLPKKKILWLVYPKKNFFGYLKKIWMRSPILFSYEPHFATCFG